MTPLYHYVGWALLLAMGAVSLSIVGPGLLIAVRVLFSGASVVSPAPRRPSAPANEARTALTTSHQGGRHGR